ncbi:eIF-2-alpha kinase activator GCN1-like isoform X1 [Strongylocentrotus purpuratus]|uniref:TOG domain-containing protein n=2 Tax=Strongylocentrotus purpuratus TaxID=7668 RepID=A0A7M7SSL7_STRPU|nr:eIF-2-alpha kinase activator GCN1-like isoform X1 [Strongylocentrotus purpuratus]
MATNSDGVTTLLKGFASRVACTNTKERCQILSEVRDCVSTGAVPEAAVKTICRILAQTIPVFADGASRKAVLGLIGVLCAKYRDASVKALCDIIGSYVTETKIVQGWKGTGGSPYVVLRWTCILSRQAFTSSQQRSGNEWKKLVDAQATLVSAILACSRRSIHTAGYTKLKGTWKQVEGLWESSLDTAKQLDVSSHALCLIGWLLRYATETKNTEAVANQKKALLDVYIKTVFGGKVKPLVHSLEVSKWLLQHLTHPEFESSILPAIQKAMLRSPENVVQAVSYTIGGVSLDLSQYATELGKNIATQLHAKDETLRLEAISAAENLALQCSDPSAIESLSKHFFAVLGGSEGKLTVVSERAGVLSGIGGLSVNGVSGVTSVQSLVSSVMTLFMPYLQQEAHEGTMVHGLTMLSRWCSKSSTELPPKLIQWFQKAMTQKQSTAATRNGCIRVMLNALKGDTLIHGIEIIPLLQSSLEKAQQQPNHAAMVTEALSAACLLVRLSTSDVQAENKVSFLWPVILDEKKQLLTSDKFLSVASEDALLTLVEMTERLLTDHVPLIKPGVERSYHRALVSCLIHSKWRVRKAAKQMIKKLLSTPKSAIKLSLKLLQEFRPLLNAQKPLDSCAESATPEDTGRVRPDVLVSGIKSLVPGTKEEDEIPSSQMVELAVDSLLIDTHHPLIAAVMPSLWGDIVSGLVPDLPGFISESQAYILNLLLEKEKASEAAQNAMKSLAFIAPQHILPPFINQFISCLGNPGFVGITLEEFDIYRTPEGVLHDESVIEKNAEKLDIGSMKRENKAYSYKEQLLEIELKKEIERERAQKGIKVEVKLTKKQEEAKKVQLAKEGEIRKKLQELNDEIEPASKLLVAAVKGNPYGLRKHIPTLINNIFTLSSSPIAAPHLAQVFLALADCAFEADQRTLADTVSYCTLRLSKPACPIAENWCTMKLPTMVINTILKLHGGKDDEDIDDGDDFLSMGSATVFPAPSFAYFFRLLHQVLYDGGVVVKKDEKNVKRALAILSSHCNLRSSMEEEEESDVIDESGPELLPRHEMLSLLFRLIGIGGVQQQRVADEAIVELCRSASGDMGCTVAETDEIDVILKAMTSPVLEVRVATLKGLRELLLVLPTQDSDDPQGMRIAQRIWCARKDVDIEVRTLADEVWTDGNFKGSPELCTMLLDDVIHDIAVIRQSGAAALSAILAENPEELDKVMSILFKKYQEKLVIPPPVMDTLGRVISESPPDQYDARCGIAIALSEIAPHLLMRHVPELFKFLVPKGLGDRNAEVQKEMLNAGMAAIIQQGKPNVATLLPLFEKFMDEAPDSSSYDTVRQSVIILMGSLARHLEKEDPKVKPIVGKLIEALSTPSQPVQQAVAACLPPLVPAIKKDAPGIVKELLKLLLESENFGERKGAAYGLAGMVKGLGILSLKQLEIMSTLQSAIQDKKNFRKREGALFAFEMLCSMLGRLFEPYVVHVIPHLLLCFGDSNQYVRDATDDTSRAVMSKLSGHGVKLVLPSLLAALEEDSWRTKAGSVELLGNMAYCAPKQLSSCLPSIVPKLTEVLTDSHAKVQKAGAQALKQIGNVIRNPEIQAIVPRLLEALSNPSQQTASCLKILLDTKFVHFIDAPSLALIMPVVQRSFQDRSTETKKMACQIIGNMYSLTDQKDLAPYLPSVMPGLKSSLLDPVPDVRKVSARALGAMVKGMGESSFDDLLPWLMEKLTSEQNSVDRSGAAQGLSEVIAGMGLQKLEKFMPDLVKTAETPDIASHVRDGYIMMFIYLPGTFGDKFAPFVGPCISPLLVGLADESEYVRDTALRAGQRIINLYAETAVNVFLPELEKGLFDDNWRIRYSSVQLLGDLLYRISGVTGKMTTVGDDDDNFGTEHSTKAIITILGAERRNRVFAGLYMGRSDTALMVRQAALHVWKVVVVNTPRTLKDILSTLFTLLLGCLASTSYDKRQVAARTLGDLVRKLGDRVLPEMIPVLEKGLDSAQSDQRQGVCIGLSEIINSTSREQVVTYVESLVTTVKRALVDPLQEVREAAARTFDSLHSSIGHKALEEILPELLSQLSDEEKGTYALDGLKQVMAVKNRVVLPFLIPKLIAPPVNTGVLAILSEVAGDSLTKHLAKILNALMSAVEECVGTEREQEALKHCQRVVMSVQDLPGQQIIIDELLQKLKGENAGLRLAASTLLQVYCSKTSCSYSDYVPQLQRALIQSFNDPEPRVLEMSWEALNAVTKSLSAAEQMGHIESVRRAVRYATEDCKQEDLPGFCLPKKGITPILPYFREGILSGSPEVKELAALALGEVVQRTSIAALKPQVVAITGPLIRVLGDRFAWNVKVAILQTLGLLIAKVGVLLKAFLPQLQTTFIRGLTDANRAVRLEAAAALGKLVVIHAKVDPLFTELHNGIKNTDNDTGVRETMLQALKGAIAGAGTKIGDANKKALQTTLISNLSSSEGNIRISSSGCLGALCKFLSDEDFEDILNNRLLVNEPNQNWMLHHSCALALSVTLKDAPERVTVEGRATKVLEVIIKNSLNDRIPVCVAGVRGMGFYMKHCIATGEQVPQSLLSAMVKCFNHSSSDIKMAAAQMINHCAMTTESPLDMSIVRGILVVLVSNTKDKNTAVQADSEWALVALLKLKHGDEFLQDVLKSLDSVPASNLNDCLKRLRKVASQNVPNFEFDETVLR